MKKFLPAIIALLCLSLITSCKKKDEVTILGTWEARTELGKVFTDGVKDSETPYSYAPNETTIEFKNDNTYTVYENGSFSENGVYSISGDQMVMDFETFTFTLSKTNLDLFSTYEEMNNGHTVRYENEIHLVKIIAE
jgi:hypothetical protein